MKWRLDMEITNPLNGAQFHQGRKRARVRKKQRDAVALVCGQGLRVFAGRPNTGDILTTLTRIGPGTLDEPDGISAGFKSVRDEVAKHLGRDDRPGTGLHWRYAQRKEGKGVYAIEIEVSDHAPNTCPTCLRPLDDDDKPKDSTT